MNSPDAAGSYDVIVCGAGASGMMTALTARVEGASVLLLEKASKLGGTAAVSGGVVWAPCNRRMAEAGTPDSREAALEYFRSLAGNELDPETLEGFIDHCGEALDFLESHAPVRFEMIPGYPDYYLDRPGAVRGGGRALDSGLFSFVTLGDWRDRVATNGAPLPLTLSETPLGGCTGTIDPEVMATRIAGDYRGMGQALVGGLLKACLDAGVEIRLDCPAAHLIEKDGRVAGVSIATANNLGQVFAARRGVILCTGGFESDPVLRQTFLRGPLDYPASPPTNHGDGLRLAMRAGAALGQMTKAWWMPVIAPPEDTWFDGEQHSHPVLFERTLPHSILVNGAGKRFCNEAVSYVSLVGALHQRDPATDTYKNLPVWLVFDHAYKMRYAIAGRPPGEAVPDWMHHHGTIAELAASIGVDPEALEATVAGFNRDAREGTDSAFGRGRSDYDRFYGDRSRAGPLATLGALETPPFYAVRIEIGALGTCGGAKTDSVGRVLDQHSSPIAGLYAAGNVSASPTAGIYAGAGGTLGPALTYGFLAGRHAGRGAN